MLYECLKLTSLYNSSNAQITACTAAPHNSLSELTDLLDICKGELTTLQGLLHAACGITQREEVLQVTWWSDSGAIHQQTIVSLKFHTALGCWQWFALIALDGISCKRFWKCLLLQTGSKLWNSPKRTRTGQTNHNGHGQTAFHGGHHFQFFALFFEIIFNTKFSTSSGGVCCTSDKLTIEQFTSDVCRVSLPTCCPIIPQCAKRSVASVDWAQRKQLCQQRALLWVRKTNPIQNMNTNT